jgi:hypothetical protein
MTMVVRRSMPQPALPEIASNGNSNSATDSRRYGGANRTRESFGASLIA